MLSCTYEVVAIDGDYAHLRRNDIEPEDNEMKLVAPRTAAAGNYGGQYFEIRDAAV